MQKKAKQFINIKALLVFIIFGSVLGFSTGGAYALYSTSIFDVAEDNVVRQNEEKGNYNQETDGLLDMDDETINILVLGLDEEEDMTDVIMVANINPGEKTVNVLQIPRDTYVGDHIPTGKMNAVYSHPEDGKNRLEGLIGEINKRFKLSIDHYVIMTLDVFKAVVDSMGGVEVDVPQQINFDANLGMVIKKGKQTLNGQQAEWFVRYRKGYVTADLGRQEAQVVFLKALITKMFTISRTEAVTIATNCVKMIETDLTAKDLLDMYKIVMKGGKDSITFHRVPGEGVNLYYDNGNSNSIFGVEKEELSELLNKYFRPNSPNIKPESLPLTGLQEIKDSPYNREGSGVSDEDEENSGGTESGDEESETSGETSFYSNSEDDPFDYKNEEESSEVSFYDA